MGNAVSGFKRTAGVALTMIAAASIACGRKAPDAPEVPDGPDGAAQTVTGGERLGWTQSAADAAELATFGYAVYVDGSRSELVDVRCAPPAVPSPATVECSAPLPPLSAGTHTLAVAAFIVEGRVIESAPSTRMAINKIGGASLSPSPPAAVAWQSGVTTVTVDGLRLQVDRVGEGFVRPTDVAFLPDGRLLVAEEQGIVRVLMPDGRVMPEVALSLMRFGAVAPRLVALAVDADFDRTHFVSAVFTTESRGGRRTYTLARYREASNLLVDETVLLDGVPATAAGGAALRVGMDGKLFAAFDNGGDPRLAGDMASHNGKVLRLNHDGTTPADQAGLTPMYALGLSSPRAFDWQPSSGVLWVVDRTAEDAALLIAIGSPAGARKRGAALASYTLPRETRPSAAAFYRGSSLAPLRNDLLIASEEGRHLLRVRFDRDATKILASERLLQDVVGPIRVVAVSPSGTVYLATDDAVARLGPAE